MLRRVFIAALWSPAGKGLTSWFLFVFCHFPIWYPGSGVVLDCIISDLCRLSNFERERSFFINSLNSTRHDIPTAHNNLHVEKDDKIFLGLKLRCCINSPNKG